MKKLMMAVAIVCAAVAAQATTIKWDSAGVLIAGDFTDPVVADNFAIYLFDASSYDSATIVGEIAGGNFDSLENAMGHDVIVGGGLSPVGITSSIATKDPVNYFALLFDAADATQATYVFATPDYTEPMPDTGTLYTSYDGDSIIIATDYSTKENWTQVAPEPTSGLLLLIGMAGLALRRRRA